MFENLQGRFAKVLNNLRGQGRLSDDNIQETLREVRMALLEADVALPVVREFVEHVRQQAGGRRSPSP
jgi:signal recognition particle subunit SRP54